MSFTEERFGGHPATEFLHSVSEGASKVAETSLWSLPDADVADLVVMAARARAQIEAIELRLVGETDGRGVPAREAAPSTQAWLRGPVEAGPGCGGRSSAARHRVEPSTGHAGGVVRGPYLRRPRRGDRRGGRGTTAGGAARPARRRR